MTDLDKAREWADRKTGSLDMFDSETQATIKLIKSLPDQWVDVEKVLEEAGRMDKGAENAMKPGHNEFSRGYAEAMRECARHLRDLIPTPSLPTLADMTQEEREACKWMQCKIEGFDKNLFIISTGSRRSKAVGRDGYDVACINSDITPLPDLPKLQWPGGVNVSNEEKVADDQAVAKDACNKSSPKPEDVPPNEPWLVKVYGTDRKAVATRWFMESSIPWTVAFMDGAESGDYADSQVELICRMVPETHILPEGMRLADSEEYGRIVVSPETDENDDHLIFYSAKDVESGAAWNYLHDHEFTYVDGDH